MRPTFIVFAAVAAAAVQLEPRALVAARVMTLTRDAQWRRVAAVPVRFRTYHPQGMVKIGEALFVSSVEVTAATKRFETLMGGLDRDPGEGIGHLFKMDMSGNLLADVRLGERTIYHAGGLDYDGTSVWVPVAEYRPNSRSIIYRVDAGAMRATEVFRFPDHIGALAYDTDDNTLHGANWGSRRFYRWHVHGGQVTDTVGPPQNLGVVNPSHYVDYQDCKYVGGHRMLCTGVTELRAAPEALPFRLGGMDLVDLRDYRPLHQVPVLLWTPGGLDMTHNPVWIEATRTGLRGYFMPEDNTSTLYIYEVDTLGE